MEHAICEIKKHPYTNNAGHAFEVINSFLDPSFDSDIRIRALVETDQGAETVLKVGASITGHKANYPSENHGSNDGNHYADDQTVLPDSPES